jgi:hypothetical protein
MILGVQFHVSMKVDVAALAGWKPEAVAAFLDGIARVLSVEAAVARADAESESRSGVDLGKPPSSVRGRHDAR